MADVDNAPLYQQFIWLGYNYNIRSTERIEICGHSDNSMAILSVWQEMAGFFPQSQR